MLNLHTLKFLLYILCLLCTCTVGTSFEICWIKRGNVGGFFFWLLGEKKIRGKMWVLTFIRPVHKIEIKENATLKTFTENWVVKQSFFVLIMTMA